MIDFKGINFESIKLRIGSLIGRVFTYHREEHDEKIVNAAIASTKIEKQFVFNLPADVSQSERKELISAIIDGTRAIEGVPSEASGSTVLPTPTVNRPIDQFLQQRLVEYKKDNNLLLDKGGLFTIYKTRGDFSFSKDELVFLTQSSFKYDFPFWFWAFYYREKFNNVAPLLEDVYAHTSIKVRKATITALSKFTETENNIVSLAEHERNSEALGHIILTLIKKGDVNNAQRVTANSLTRHIIPDFSDKAKSELDKTSFDLGAAEKRFLYSVIEIGWPEEIIRALTILQPSVNETDLPALEKLFGETSFPKITLPILKCIKRIGKTSKVKEIEKGLLDAKWEEYFVSYLDVLVAVKHKAIFPKLLIWLGNINQATIGWWRDFDERKLEEKVQESIITLLDKETYEQLVQYILDNYKPDKYGNIMSWRHIWVLRESVKSPEIATLLKSETRLADFERWNDVIDQIKLSDESVLRDDAEMLSSINPENLKHNFLILREWYKTADPVQVLQKLSPIMEHIRETLKKKLEAISSGEHSQEVKEIAKNELENFLGENEFFYRLRRKRRAGSRYAVEGEEDKSFEKISNDIQNFSTLEKEYLAHVFKGKTAETNKLLLGNIGRPYECIYENLDKDTADAETLRVALSQVIEKHNNPLIKLRAIEAAHRLEVIDAEILRRNVLNIVLESRDNLKIHTKQAKGSDDWFPYELAYTWGIRTLVGFGTPEDFPLVVEEVNREKILTRQYHQYSYFFDHDIFNELMSLTENLDDDEERNNASMALDSLDYKWTKEILNIEA